MQAGKTYIFKDDVNGFPPYTVNPAAQAKVFRRIVHDSKSILAHIYLEQLVLHRTHPVKSEFCS